MKEITKARAYIVYFSCQQLAFCHSNTSPEEIMETYYYDYLQSALDPFGADINFNPLRDELFLNDLSKAIGYVIDNIEHCDWPIDVIDDFDIIQKTLDSQNIKHEWKVLGDYGSIAYSSFKRI